MTREFCPKCRALQEMTLARTTRAVKTKPGGQQEESRRSPITVWSAAPSFGARRSRRSPLAKDRGPLAFAVRPRQSRKTT